MDSGSVAWVLTSAALVLFMTPGLAFFYGGMDRTRNVLNMLMMNFYCVLIVPVLWVIAGYSLSSVPFGNDFLGGFDSLFLKDIDVAGDGGALATIAFLGMFAAITPALISGAVADRMKFSAWALFVPLWLFLVYVPDLQVGVRRLARSARSLDFAGGTAIHVNAGIASLAAVLVLGKRRGDAEPPHSMPLVMIGAGILWFGWFGFNAGSALAANGVGGAGVHEHVRRCRCRRSRVGGRGVGPRRSSDQPRCRVGHRRRPGGHHAGRRLRVGSRTDRDRSHRRRRCCYAVRLKTRVGYDDALDVVGVHFVGGLVGSLLIGFFANPDFFEGSFMEGVFYGGSLKLFGEQVLANGVAIVWSFAITFGIMTVLKQTIGVRVSDETEAAGLDLVEHGETAYHGNAA